MATTSATAGTLQALGIGSGIDVNSLVTQLVTSELQPDTARISRDSTQVATQLTAVGQLKGALSTFQSAVNALNSQADFQVKAAVSSDEKKATVSAASTAAPGVYKVEVNSLAQAQQLRSNPITGDGTSSLGTGGLTLTLGSKSFTINVTDDKSSLNAIRDAINSASDNPGISATIVHSGSTSQLILSSNNTGAANEITVATDSNNAGLQSLIYDNSHTSNYTEIQGAADASVTVAGITVTSATNTVANAIDGVTINLLAETDENTPIKLTISNDTSTVLNRVQTFVNSYNTLQGVISQLGSYDSASQKAGPLLGDALLTGISTQLRRTLSNPVAGVNGSVNTLAGLGITTSKDGSLSLDTTKFNKAVSANFNTVSAIFGGAGGVASSLSTYVDNQLASGSGIDSRNKTLATRQKQITTQQAAIAARQAQLATRYTAQFTAMDKALAQMQQTSSYLTQQFNTLAKISSGNSG
ncbi:MAG TPA: flagellar filament capping protein FliD [Steroidobacteraceae bacterium]|jgi:flagellar hook-associated protein 2|nr:flagellar filament capping protein FliD [Steroidobacteraceae bacterium]